MRRKIGHAVLGIGFIVLGAGYAGKHFGLWEFNIFFDGWWTLFLIVPGIISIVERGFDIGNILITGVGVVFLLERQGLIKHGITVKMMWPAILVIIGIAILYKAFFTTHVRFSKSSTGESHTENFALFSGINKKNNSPDFKGGSATAIFGGVELDLREARVNENISFDATAVFGGVELRVPKNVRVEIKGLPIFGSIEDKTVRSGEFTNVITINALAVFGGVEVI